jgi:hypothetical protein
MNLSFNFNPVDTVAIYADDPEYQIGKKAVKGDYRLTERQEQVKNMFLHLVSVVRRKELPVNIDRLLDATRDYVQERRLEEYEWTRRVG